jgi:peptide/nickel transport system ATP-binding protein/oligopeptide transport system ATP-binding protein
VSAPKPLPETPLLAVEDVAKTYRVGRGRRLRALDGASLTLAKGETLGIVGESGCGKTTLAKVILRLERPDAGAVRLGGQDLLAARGRAGRELGRGVQIVFQDPMGSLDPRFTAGRSIAEPLAGIGVRGPAARERVAEVLEAVSLDPLAARLYPHQFSGGQRQRIAIARALATGPDLVVLDEPTSALDVSVQAHLLNTLLELQVRTGIAYLFISHDLGVVGHLAHRIAVMSDGRIVEEGPAERILAAPAHPHTRDLVAGVPTLTKEP